MNSGRVVRFSRLRESLVVLAAAVLTASSCGGSGAGKYSSTSPTNTGSTPSPTALTFPLTGVNSTAAGTISLTTEPGTMTVELKIAGLQPTSSHIAHVHIGSCKARGLIQFALNQVLADGQGNADIATTFRTTYPPPSGTWYVVVHAGPDLQGSNSNYLLCGNLFK
ncbi:MAG: CHRD domain-containing protein [Candidatus Dormibacteraeota bacterium]|nr:CHRD domain-containing protein [Candidatus Dormibacteraeota bacterium]